MDTELPLPFLVSIPDTLGGLTHHEISVLGCSFLDAKPQRLQTSDNPFHRRSAEFRAYLDATALESAEDVVDLLDHGAKRVFVAPGSLFQFSELGDRVLPVVRTPDLSAASRHGLLIRDFDPNTWDVSKFIADAQATKPRILYIKPVEGASLSEFLEIAQKINAVPILPSADLTTDRADTSRLLLSQVLSSYWRSDRSDGLIPTVVTDEAGISLGLAYTSQESILQALRTQKGVYHSRKRGLWIKGATSGDTQELLRIALDCDNDTLKFVVKQKGRFCHLEQFSCFGNLSGIAALEQTLFSRKESAPSGSYTGRLFSDENLLRAKIMEEAEELCEAKTREEVAFEAADLIYFALVKAVSAGVSLADVQTNLDAKSLKIRRRPGNAKGKWAEKENTTTHAAAAPAAASLTNAHGAAPGNCERIIMQRVDSAAVSGATLQATLQRPSQKCPDSILKIVAPIIDDVRNGGDKALLSYTHKFEKATSLTSPVLKAPFPTELMKLSAETVKAIDQSYENIRKFHAAQAEAQSLSIETMPGVMCGRFSRAIERVGLYVPGGTAVLPSTALMLGVPAMVAGCKRIVLASPPRADGSISPEIVYIAQKVGAESIVLAGGAQAVAAMAYGTESVAKVDKILGPGNQFVTAAKMHVSNDTNAGVSIDMPAGPSEVLVVADKDAKPAFVASDLLSQAEHGVDSQVILLAVDLSEAQLKAIEDEVHNQAMALPRVDIVRGSIKHSVIVTVGTIDEAMRISNDYAPEHLILQVKDASSVIDKVMNAGSVFIGEWTPESVGDYSAGVNHSLPTYGYAKQYSGVNLGSFMKHITCASLTSQGLLNVGSAVMQLASVENLDAHKRAVEIRLKYMDEKR